MSDGIDRGRRHVAATGLARLAPLGAGVPAAVAPRSDGEGALASLASATA